jgi:predicted GNAT family acetyltransferase
MSEVTITHQVQGQGGKYTAQPADSDHSGYLSWEPDKALEDDVRVATHTVVPPQIGGRGIAAQLVERLVSDAKEQGFKIKPQCSYVAAKFDENPEWGDLKV